MIFNVLINIARNARLKAQGGIVLMNRLSAFKVRGLVYRDKDREEKSEMCYFVCGSHKVFEYYVIIRT